MTAVADPLPPGPTPPAFDPERPARARRQPVRRPHPPAARGCARPPVGRFAVEPGAVVTGGVEQLASSARWRGTQRCGPRPRRQAVRRSGVVEQPVLPAAPAGLPRRTRRPVPAGRRGGPRRQEPRRALFALSLVTEAAAPTNTLLGNPSALGKAWQTRGQSLVAGLRHFRHDLRHNGGMPSMVDHPAVRGRREPRRDARRGDPPQRAVRAHPVRAGRSRTHRRPLVAIPPQINKYYISDLAPAGASSSTPSPPASPTSRSAGATPRPRSGPGPRRLRVRVQGSHRRSRVTSAPRDDANVAGMCAGGITLACLLGHLAATDEPLVNSATFMVAGLDISSESTVGLLTSGASIEAARSRSSAGACSTAGISAGCSPGCGRTTWSGTTGSTTTCSAESAGVRHPLLERRHHQPPGRPALGLPRPVIERPGPPGSIEVLGTPVDLGKVRCDAYVVAGATDHIIPWTAAYQTTQMLGGDSSSCSAPAATSRPSSTAREEAAEVPDPPGPPPPIPTSGAPRHHQRGDLVDHWLRWLGERSGGERRAPPRWATAATRPIEAAPGPVRAPVTSRHPCCVGSSRSSRSTGTSSGVDPG